MISKKKLKVDMKPSLLVLKKGEPIIEGILSQVKGSVSLSGIGAIKDPELAYYHLDRGEYASKKYKGIFEIASINGVTTELDGKLHAHIHVVLGDAEHNTYCGHLMGGEVGVTLELTLIYFDKLYHRTYDQDTKLNLIQTEKPIIT